MGKKYPNVVKNHEGDLCVRSFSGLTPLYMCRAGSVVFFRSLDGSDNVLDGRAGHIIGFDTNTWDELTFMVKFQRSKDNGPMAVHPINIEVVG